MEQAQILFPDLPSPGPSRVVQFQARPSRRTPRDAPAGRLNGEGLAQRLRSDVQRQLAHRRRMLEHLEAQSRA
jgi:hypothetical protein